MKEKDYLKKITEEELPDKGRVLAKAREEGERRAQDNATKNFFKTKGFAAVASAVVLVAAFLTMAFVYYTPATPQTNPEPAVGYDDIYNVIKEFRNREKAFNIGVTLRATSVMDSAANEGAALPGPTASDSTSDYSSTNVQTKGMDEGDIVKTDGRYIYKLSANGCYIVSVNNGELEVASEIIIDNYVPKEMFISGNKLVLMGGIYETVSYGNFSVQPAVDCFYYMSYNKTDVRVYDIADVSAPVLERQITLDGNFYTSRLNTDSNELYFLVTYYFRYGNQEAYIPGYADSAVNGGESAKLPAENIMYYDDVVQYSYLLLGKIDLDSAADSAVVKGYLGLGGTVYVSSDNIYVATADYRSSRKVNLFGWVSGQVYNYQTRIVKIALSDLSQKAAGRVDGTVKDRYSLDEYQGYLRVATTSRGNETYNNVFVLKPDLTAAGKITGIAPGESIYSVRFNGATGSLVTFRQVDPYFNLDLSDPFNPSVSKGLKEDGVSHYIHYIGDTSYTIGVGQMTETYMYAGTERVRWIGLKISLYDNSSGEAVNINTTVIEGSAYSELFYNPKALLYNEERGLFAFTYENWRYDDNYSYSRITQGLAVFTINLDAEEDADKLVYGGTLTNVGGGSAVNLSGYDYYYDYYLSFVTRGVQIGGYIYTVSDRIVKSYDIVTLANVSAVTLYETEK